MDTEKWIGAIYVESPGEANDLGKWLAGHDLCWPQYRIGQIGDLWYFEFTELPAMRMALAWLEARRVEDEHRAAEQAVEIAGELAYERFLEDGAGNAQLQDELRADLEMHEALFPDGYCGGRLHEGPDPDGHVWPPDGVEPQ